MSNNLHQLIRSLTQNEKRYFKLHAAFMFKGDDKRFVKLFEVIEKQRIYNESVAKIKMGEKHFAQLKLQLFNKVLESLRAFHEGNDVLSLINKYRQEYKILLNKSLLVPAEKALNKAKLIAEDYELYPELVSLMHSETELLVAQGSISKLQTHIKNLRKHIPSWLTKTDNLLLIENEYLLFVKFNKEMEFVRTEAEQRRLEKLIEAPILKNSKNIESTRGKIYYYYIMGLFYFFSGRFSKSLEAFKSQLELFEANQHYSLELGIEHAKALANVCLLYNKTRDQISFQIYFEKLSRLSSTTNLLNNQIKYRNYLLQLNFLVVQDKIKEAIDLIKREHSEINELEAKMMSTNTMYTELNYVMFDTIYVYMSSNEFSKANRIVNNYLNNTMNSNKSDNFVLARILHLFIQYELNNDDYLENEIRSLTRFLKENNKLHKFESLSIKTLALLINEKNTYEIKLIWKHYLTQLERLAKSRFEGNAMFSFDFIRWAKKKI